MPNLYVPEYDPKRNVIVVAEPEMLSPKEFCRRLGVVADNTPIEGEALLGQLMARGFLNSRPNLVHGREEQTTEIESIELGKVAFIKDYPRNLFIFIGADGNQYRWDHQTFPEITDFLTEIGATEAQQNNFFKFYSQGFASPIESLIQMSDAKKIHESEKFSEEEKTFYSEAIGTVYLKSGGDNDNNFHRTSVFDFSQDRSKVVCNARAIGRSGQNPPHYVTSSSFEVSAAGVQNKQFGASELPQRVLQIGIEQKMITQEELDAILGEKQRQEAAAKEYQRVYAQYDAGPNKSEPTPLARPRVVFSSDLWFVETPSLHRSLMQDQVARAYPKIQTLQRFQIPLTNLIEALNFHPSSLMLQQRFSEIEATNVKERKLNPTVEISNPDMGNKTLRTRLSNIAVSINKSPIRRLFSLKSLAKEVKEDSEALQSVFFGNTLLEGLEDHQLFEFEAKNANFRYALSSYPLEVLQQAYNRDKNASATFVRGTEWFQTFKTATRKEIAEYWQKEPVKKLLSLDTALTIELMKSNVELAIFFMENDAARKQVGLVKKDLPKIVEDIPYLIRQGRFGAAFSDKNIQGVINLHRGIQETAVISFLKNCDNSSLITLFKALTAGKAGNVLQPKKVAFESFLDDATKLILEGTYGERVRIDGKPAVNNLAAAISGNSEVALAVFDYLQKQYAEAPEANKAAYLTRLVDLARADHSGKVAEKLLETSRWISWRDKHPSTKLTAEQIVKIVAAHEHNDAVLKAALELTDKREIALISYADLNGSINSQNTLKNLGIKNVSLTGEFREEMLNNPQMGHFDLLVREFEAKAKKLPVLQKFIKDLTWNISDARGFFKNSYLVNFVVVNNLLPTKVLADLLTDRKFESLRPLIQLNYPLSGKQQAELIDELASRNEIPDMIPGTPYHYVQRQALIVKGLGGARPRPQPEPEVQPVPAAVQGVLAAEPPVRLQAPEPEPEAQLPQQPAPQVQPVVDREISIEAYSIIQPLINTAAEESLDKLFEFIGKKNFANFSLLWRNNHIKSKIFAAIDGLSDQQAKNEAIVNIIQFIRQKIPKEQRKELLGLITPKQWELIFSTTNSGFFKSICNSLTIRACFTECSAEVLPEFNDVFKAFKPAVNDEKSIAIYERFRNAVRDEIFAKRGEPNLLFDFVEQTIFQSESAQDNFNKLTVEQVQKLFKTTEDPDKFSRLCDNKVVKAYFHGNLEAFFAFKKFQPDAPPTFNKFLAELDIEIFNTADPEKFKMLCQNKELIDHFSVATLDVLVARIKLINIFIPAILSIDQNIDQKLLQDYQRFIAAVQDQTFARTEPDFLFEGVRATIFQNGKPQDRFNQLKAEHVKALFATTIDLANFTTLCKSEVVKQYFEFNSYAIEAFKDPQFRHAISNSGRGEAFEEFLRGLSSPAERLVVEVQGGEDTRLPVVQDLEFFYLALISVDTNHEKFTELWMNETARQRLFQYAPSDTLHNIVVKINTLENRESLMKELSIENIKQIFENTNDPECFRQLCLNTSLFNYFSPGAISVDDLKEFLDFKPQIFKNMQAGDEKEALATSWGSFIANILDNLTIDVEAGDVEAGDVEAKALAQCADEHFRKIGAQVTLSQCFELKCAEATKQERNVGVWGAVKEGLQPPIKN